jgi:hypothetical protein
MNPMLEESVAQITSGFHVLAVAVIVVGVAAVLVGRKSGGKTKGQRKATADLVWGIGLLVMAVLLIPRLFGA